LDKDRLDKAWRAGWFVLPFLPACLVAFLVEHRVERLIGNEGASQSRMRGAPNWDDAWVWVPTLSLVAALPRRSPHLAPLAWHDRPGR